MPSPELSHTFSLNDLPQFSRNRPDEADLFGTLPGVTTEESQFTHMMLLSSHWHNLLATRTEDRVKTPGYGDVQYTEEKAALIMELVEKMRCTAALASIIESGPGALKMRTDGPMPSTDLSTFVRENPYFYVTARAGDQQRTDPRFVAKLEDVVVSGYNYADKSVTLKEIVSDPEGNEGRFPTNTVDWKLAHIATTGVGNITHTFPYLNDGRR